MSIVICIFVIHHSPRLMDHNVQHGRHCLPLNLHYVDLPIDAFIITRQMPVGMKKPTQAPSSLCTKKLQIVKPIPSNSPYLADNLFEPKTEIMLPHKTTLTVRATLITIPQTPYYTLRLRFHTSIKHQPAVKQSRLSLDKEAKNSDTKIKWTTD